MTPRFAVSCSTAELQLLTELLGAYRFLHSSRWTRGVGRVFVGVGGRGSWIVEEWGKGECVEVLGNIKKKC